MIKREKNEGQSMVELIFSLGVLVLVLGGVVTLLVRSMSSRSEGFDRKKASELAEIVMEELVAEERNTPDIFWQRENLSEQTNTDFDGYEYNVGFSGVDGTADCVGVGRRCFYVEVVVNWTRDEEKSISFSRYFTDGN
ncbi:hypothetical protein KKC08_02030 [Patescibacteria group bacterium]|nr:hypothetical protein [Patescibacteria group bacterium]MCG2702701.1 hypothetical protein [Candidatus Parcubacteria bacterium]MBU4265316.1 hypothetical protein [Patescibacteria group bacterium]MBU4390001.1 hypothetical protein [Patescibacteria group bacterium]MBU4396918.1 hypothetical protein [Patescibacteria group bacterium]